ncbi:HyaD/HybD family hydrogenase maturation endopeptidase [Candidatus Viridilinea mediisalina]|uniref:HyaD/HybD family hydrogenase maturation endopeptidase n=1 Tax=Candidatus Viridilinea mediisalina TaxID=2024553 RepID=UPI0013FE050F|nr:HyaD/HybD family hydrogenase maturation endopeptidase [Candidatus Viridilinea mediisalina]
MKNSITLPTSSPPRLLILGIGNRLCSDDGLGGAAVERLLERYQLPAGVVARDGGVLGLHLLPDLVQVEQLIIIDAVDSEQEPGQIIRREGAAIVPSASPQLSLHQCGLSDLLAVAQALGSCPAQTILWGIVPASTAPGLSLSPVVAAQLDRLVEQIIEDIGILWEGS